MLFGIFVLLIFVLFLTMGIKIVPQSQNYVIERLGRYRVTLKAGLNIIVPFLDYVSNKVSVLEQQLPQSSHDVITKDNVTIVITTSIFFRVQDAAKATYKIENLEMAINTTVTGTIRAHIGTIEFDEVQSHRENINLKIKKGLTEASQGWGVVITRAEIVDVEIDEATQQSIQKQLNAERERRAAVMKAEGEKQAAYLNAEATLYAAQKEADAKRILADAEAYSTKVLAEMINNGGESAIQFEALKRQVDAVTKISASGSSKIIILPSDTLQAFQSVKDIFTKSS